MTDSVGAETSAPNSGDRKDLRDALDGDCMIRGAYVSINVLPSDWLLQQQREVCQDYALAPRNEFHVTLGYVGSVCAARIEALSQRLASQVPEGLANLTVEGTGGAFELGGRTVPVRAGSSTTCLGHFRVIWHCVRLSPELAAMRQALINTASDLGIDAPRLAGLYYPHITLGSGGPPGDGATHWDAHGIAKAPTLGRCTGAVNCDKVHVTSSAFHPGSLHVIRHLRRNGPSF